jgi:Fe-S cluster biosynthesis and repair protein YggX
MTPIRLKNNKNNSRQKLVGFGEVMGLNFFEAVCQTFWTTWLTNGSDE